MTSVAEHLKIGLSEYDRRIRTFIPGYREMLDVTAQVAALTSRRAPAIVDLGVGTGALAARCLALSPRARIHGIDADPAMLRVAERRLGGRGGNGGRHSFAAGDFTRVSIPRCNAIVATLSLHHVHSARAKGKLYRRLFRALKPGGVLASGDAFLSQWRVLRRAEMDLWRGHMRRRYSARQVSDFFTAWAHEDRYLPLDLEIGLLQKAGFRVDVPWRRAPFAVVVGFRGTRGRSRPLTRLR